MAPLSNYRPPCVARNPNFIVRWITKFLFQRKQRVKVGHCVSQWAEVNAGVPQGTRCCPVCFLLHINDLWTCCDTLKYVEDSSVWEICSSECHDNRLQQAAEQAETWFSRTLMKINAAKTKSMHITFFTKDTEPPPIIIDDTPIEQSETFKVLGVILLADLSWGPHVEYLHSKCSQRLFC